MAEVAKGRMDFLFVSILLGAKFRQYDTFRFGLSSLTGVGEQEHDPALENALHYIYEHVNQFHNFKGLHELKEKFNPAWYPRYLIFPGNPNLPAVAVALARADSGGDFIIRKLKN